MLSVSETKIPRKVSIKVARAENLNESINKDGKKKTNNKFKVVVLGGKKKETSSIETSSNGNVNWTFTTIIKLHRNQTDPLCLMVEDSDGHHKGQVIIPIVKIPPKPYTYSSNQDPATSNNILCSELEPTKKCSNPAGFLVYWTWIEEYYAEGEGDTGKKSFNKSMSSIFGSKSKLGSSKTNLNVKNSDTISNYSSVSSLNKPEKHKKTSSLLKLKIGKKKHKPSSSDAKITPESSDVDSLSNFSFNQGNPFENGDSSGKYDRTNNQRNAMGDTDSNNPFSGHPIITLNSNSHDLNLKSEILSHGSQDSYPESNYTKPVPITSQISSNISAVVMPRIDNVHTAENNSSIKPELTKSSSNLSNKYNTMNYQDLPSHRDLSNDNAVSVSHHGKEVETNFRLGGHNKSSIGSDYSLFTDRGFEANHQPISVKNSSDEFENIKKENTELKTQNIKCNQQIHDLQKELEFTKQTLCNLRLKLLEDGALKFLEI